MLKTDYSPTPVDLKNFFLRMAEFPIRTAISLRNYFRKDLVNFVREYKKKKKKQKQKQRQNRLLNLKKKTHIDPDDKIQIGLEHTNLGTLKQTYGDDVQVYDITRSAAPPYHKFSPVYPIGHIAVPFYPEKTYSKTVMGVYYGLKVYDYTNRIDSTKFQSDGLSMFRRCPPNSEFLGWQKGISGEQYVDAAEARWLFDINLYKEVLDTALKNDVDALRVEIDLAPGKVVFLDTNINTYDLTRSEFSHAYLLKCYLEGEYPLQPEVVVDRIVSHKPRVSQNQYY